MRHTTAFAIVFLAAMLAVPAVLGDVVGPLPTTGAEAPQAMASHRLCTASGEVCARADVTATLAGCTDNSCTVLYSLSVAIDGSGSGCAEAETAQTGPGVLCAVLPGVPAVSNPPVTASKTYHNVAADATIQEPAKLCVDHYTASESCESFAINLRLPGQRAIVVNATTTTPTKIAEASV